MEIDRLEPQEEKRRRDNNLCFTCGKPGHRAAEHKEGGSQSRPSQYQGNGKGKAPQYQEKKQSFQGNRQGRKPRAHIRAAENHSPDKAERTRNQIRKIISNTYQDQEGDDYLHFIEQVNNMGF